jgi:uncharacterized membrane-anchored protein YhcB (DUF1043 family)
MEIIFIYIIISLVIGFSIGYYVSNLNSKNLLEASNKILSKEKDNLETIKKEMENSFKAIASDVNKSNTEEFLKLANDKFKNLSQ